MAKNYIDILGEYFPGVEAYCSGDPTVYANVVWVSTPIAQVDLDAAVLADCKTDRILLFATYAQDEIVDGFLSSALGYPHMYDSEPEDQLNLIGAATTQADMDYSCRASSAGYQIIDVGGAVVGTDATGFVNDPTVYNVEVVIDGVSEYFSIAGQDAQDYDTLIAAINADFLNKATISIVSGNLKLVSDSYGATSTISIIDANCFNSLSTYVALNTAVDGIDPSTVLKEYKLHTHTQLLQVLNDGKDVKLDILQKFNVKKAQILSAVDEAAVLAITW